MFENLQERLSRSLKKISGQSKITEDNIQETLREVRMSLLEADVALPVVRVFIDRVKERATGTEVSTSLSPGQEFLKIVQAELVDVLGGTFEPLNLAAKPPVVILMAGLQGVGKTTSTAKLARYLTEREKKKVMVVSADIYRPAAIKQLQTLADEVGVEFFPSDIKQSPNQIAKDAVAHAKRQFIDVLLVDTAGRLAIDQEMMQEIQSLQKTLVPTETLFVVDAMTGQDAANTAQAFGEALDLTGVILTKADGDARGGAALSVRHITGKPIKFIGMGEKTDALEPYHPDRIASRILGMGDVLSLVEEIERTVDKDKAEKLAKKITKSKGKGFDLEDMRDQFVQMRNMGGMGALMEKMPGMGGMSQMMEQKDTQAQFKRMEAIISSMTPKERANPDILNGSRKRRITQGSGTSIQDLLRLIKQFKQMQKMMGKMSSAKGMNKMMNALGGAGGAQAPGGAGGAMPGQPQGLPGLGGGMPFDKKKNPFS
jgi:signal recognition particle subunit SRP54